MRLTRESLIAELGEPKAWQRRKLVMRSGRQPGAHPSVQSALWDCCGMHDALIEIKNLADDPSAMIADQVRSQLGVLALEALSTACCVASEVTDGSEEWKMLRVCKRHATAST